MSERIREIFIKDFQDIFGETKGRKIALYGTGQYTEWILTGCPDYGFIALIDQNKTGEIVYGFPVVTMKEVATAGCDMVIIVSNLSVAPEIFQRIRDDSEKYNIDVFYLNGIKPRACMAHEISLPDRESIIEKAKDYDVISFDLFDTLIMRKCVRPEAIFEIMCRKLGRISETECFPEIRRQAEKSIYRNGNRFFSVDDIYAGMETQGEIFGRSRAELLELELETEYENAIPVSDTISAMKKLIDMGKKVIICSDMYLDSKKINKMTEKCGLPKVDLLVSCEIKAQKYDGSMYEALKQRYPAKRILHIGDNKAVDINEAHAHGIDAFYVPNGLARANEYECLKRLKAEKEYDRVVQDLLIQRLMSRSLFAKGENGRIKIESGEDLGYIVFGPLVAGYLGWLMRNLKERNISRILFVSRDGYLFRKIYEQYREKYELPQSDYFLTSRRCVSIASIFDKEDIFFVLNNICGRRSRKTVAETLKGAFGVSEEKLGNEGKLLKVMLSELDDSEYYRIFTEDYYEAIIESASALRKRYIKYIDRLNVSKDGSIGMMNFVGRGVTQNRLQRLLGRELTGVYFGKEHEIEEFLKEDTCLSWYTEPMSTHTSRKNLFINYLQGEAIFSSDVGTLMDFTDDGAPVFAHTSEGRVQLMKACHMGILQYIEDLKKLGVELVDFQPSVSFVDNTFGLLTKLEVQFSDEICTNFEFEDIYIKKDKVR